jgi:hypothetical protein
MLEMVETVEMAVRAGRVAAAAREGSARMVATVDQPPAVRSTWPLEAWRCLMIQSPLIRRWAVQVDEEAREDRVVLVVSEDRAATAVMEAVEEVTDVHTAPHSAPEPLAQEEMVAWVVLVVLVVLLALVESVGKVGRGAEVVCMSQVGPLAWSLTTSTVIPFWVVQAVSVARAAQVV